MYIGNYMHNVGNEWNKINKQRIKLSVALVLRILQHRVGFQPTDKRKFVSFSSA